MRCAKCNKEISHYGIKKDNFFMCFKCFFKLGLKEKIETYLQHYKRIKKYDKVELFSGIKHTFYNTPNIYVGSDSSEAVEEMSWRSNHLSWFVEIWVNDRCIWRKFMGNKHYKKFGNLKRFEKPLLEKFIEDSIVYGLSYMEKIIEEHDKRQSQMGGRR